MQNENRYSCGLRLKEPSRVFILSQTMGECTNGHGYTNFIRTFKNGIEVKVCEKCNEEMDPDEEE